MVTSLLSSESLCNSSHSHDSHDLYCFLGYYDVIGCVCFCFPNIVSVLPDFSLKWLQTRILDVNENGF